MSSPPQNSLLSLLNPYSPPTRHPPPSSSSPASRLTRLSDRETSPSTMLLQELSGTHSPSAASPALESARSRSRSGRTLRAREDMSPTPTPGDRSRSRGFKAPGRSESVDSHSTSDDEGPPGSLIYGGDEGERTPRSPLKQLPKLRDDPDVARPAIIGRVSDARSGSLDPFAVGPASSSASGSPSGSRSTSPGPSTYASGMDATALQSSIAPTDRSRGPSSSPEQEPVPRRTPTFKLPPNDQVPPPRASGAGLTGEAGQGGLRQGDGYLDPRFAETPSGTPRGKGKAKQKAGREYHALSTRDDGDEAEEDGEVRGRLAGMVRTGVGGRVKTGLSGYEKALWRWVNVDDLDGFLQEVYDYYNGKGIYCIALSRILNLLTTFFVIFFSTFLLSCIDYPKLWRETDGPTAIGRLDDVVLPHCFTRGSFPHMLFILSVTAFYIFQLINFALGFPKLLDMYRFYKYLLGVPDADIQTLPWPEIVRLIGEIRKHNPVTSLSNGQAGALADMVGDDVNKTNVKKLDAHDIANRILRQENYLIALFNKDLLDLRVRIPVPRALVSVVPSNLLAPASVSIPTAHGMDHERRFLSFGANTLTKALEWNLRFCLMGYLFDYRGQVKKEFISQRKRKELVEGLQRRLYFMGVLNALFAPFIVVYLLIYSFFRYFEEYHKNPSSIGSRAYTPYAQWKFREFNELPHLFERRLDMSYPTAKEYIDQFPKERTALVMRFVAFVAGSLSAVLLSASLIDPDLFLHFEITPHRTVLFYLGVFGSILAIARGMIPEENLVFDPEASLREVVRWTHYLPGEWRGKLHSQMVYHEFGQLFSLKLNIFFTELLSVALTPFVLFFSLPACAGAIIDFFREFTVHVDGVGYVCSFAVFDFRQSGKLRPNGTATVATGEMAEVADLPPTPSASGAADQGTFIPPAQRKKSRMMLMSGRSPTTGVGAYGGQSGGLVENKMEQSFLHFKATHPDWQPQDPGSSVWLERLAREAQGLSESPGGAREGGARGGPGMSALMYPGMGMSVGAGGRGLGVGGLAGWTSGLSGDMEDPAGARLRDRSRAYDRAWAKSSHLLRGPLTSSHLGRLAGSPYGHAADPARQSGQRGQRHLETMQESQETHVTDQTDRTDETDKTEGAVVDDGWNRRVGDRDIREEDGEDGEGTDGEEERGWRRDVGLTGLLQQVMGR